MAITIKSLEALRKEMAPHAARLAETSRVVAVLLHTPGPLAQAAYDATMDTTEENLIAFGKELHRLKDAIAKLGLSIEPVVSGMIDHGDTVAAAAELFAPTPPPVEEPADE
jgi:hypothetical protein